MWLISNSGVMAGSGLLECSLRKVLLHGRPGPGGPQRSLCLALAGGLFAGSTLVLAVASGSSREEPRSVRSDFNWSSLL